jgi:hypothetical protein
MKKTNLHAIFGLLCGVFVLTILGLIGAAFGGTTGSETASIGAGLGFAFFGAGIVNHNRLIARVPGFQGVAASANAVVNLPVNRRYHCIILNLTAGGAAAAVSTIVSAMRLVVNGVPIRTITPAQTIAIAQAQGYYPRLGELPIFFTEPYRGMQDIEPNDSTSWDMADQSSFELHLTFTALANPAVSGVYEFDYLRNLLPDGKPFLQIVGMHSHSLAVAIGANDINTLKFRNPIRRLWFDSVTAGTLSALEIKQDGNPVFDVATQAQMKQIYHRYGFYFDHESRTPYQNATGPANLALDADFEAIANFDHAYIADHDYRLWRALTVANDFNIRVTSGAAEQLTIIAETVPGIYQ